MSNSPILYSTLHYTALHSISDHTTLYLRPHYTTLHYTTLHSTSDHTALHSAFIWSATMSPADTQKKTHTYQQKHITITKQNIKYKIKRRSSCPKNNSHLSYRFNSNVNSPLSPLPSLFSYLLSSQYLIPLFANLFNSSPFLSLFSTIFYLSSPHFNHPLT